MLNEVNFKSIIIISIFLNFTLYKVNANSYDSNHIYQQFKVLSTVLDNYKIICSRYPHSSEGLLKLYKHVENCWKGHEVNEKLVKDPFTNESLRYYFLGNNVNPSYKIISVGIDGKLNTKDDWSNLDDKLKQIELRKNYLKFIKDNHAILPFKTIILIFGIIVIFIIIFMIIVREKYKYKFKDYFVLVVMYFLLILFFNYIRYKS